MKLVLPKAHWGIGLSDLQRYYWAVHLTRIVDWKVHIQCKDWVIIENLIYNFNSCYVRWLSRVYISPTTLTHPLIGIIFHEFKRPCAAHTVSAKLCPITSVRGNPDFPPGLSRAFVKSEWRWRCWSNTFSEEAAFCGKLNLQRFLTWAHFHSGLIYSLNTS